MTTQPIAAEAGDDPTLIEFVAFYETATEDERQSIRRYVAAVSALQNDRMSPADAGTFDQLVAGQEWQGLDAWIKKNEFTPTK